MKILVTGATGFVGRALVPVLIKAGHEVLASVRRYSEELPDQVEQRVVGELGTKTQWEPALKGVEGVVHLAGLAHVTRARMTAEEAALFREINVEGTRGLAVASLRIGVRKFILMSSLHAVASRSSEPIAEDTLPCPDSVYATTKLEAERVLREVFNGSPIGWTILRPPLVYGPGQKANMERLVAMAVKGWPLPFGDIRNRRSLMSVQNLSNLILVCLADDRADGQLFLCSDGVVLSTTELVREIALAHGVRSNLIPVPATLLNWLKMIPGLGALAKLMDSLYIDDHHVRDRLGWKPPWTFEEGLRMMVEGGASNK